MGLSLPHVDPPWRPRSKAEPLDPPAEPGVTIIMWSACLVVFLILIRLVFCSRSKSQTNLRVLEKELAMATAAEAAAAQQVYALQGAAYPVSPQRQRTAALGGTPSSAIKRQIQVTYSRASPHGTGSKAPHSPSKATHTRDALDAAQKSLTNVSEHLLQVYEQVERARSALRR